MVARKKVRVKNTGLLQDAGEQQAGERSIGQVALLVMIGAGLGTLPYLFLNADVCIAFVRSPAPVLLLAAFVFLRLVVKIKFPRLYSRLRCLL